MIPLRPYEQARVTELMSDHRIWDMGMRLASIPVEHITNDAAGQIITDGPLPTPTSRFIEMAGFEYVRRGGHITAETDARTVAMAVLKIRVTPIDELLQFLHNLDEEESYDTLKVQPLDPSGNGPIPQEPGDLLA